MKKLIFVSISLLWGWASFAQEAQYYENNRGDQHFCGTVTLDDLLKDTTTQKWYGKNYDDFEISNKGRQKYNFLRLKWY